MEARVVRRTRRAFDLRITAPAVPRTSSPGAAVRASTSRVEPVYDPAEDDECGDKKGPCGAGVRPTEERASQRDEGDRDDRIEQMQSLGRSRTGGKHDQSARSSEEEHADGRSLEPLEGGSAGPAGKDEEQRPADAGRDDDDCDVGEEAMDLVQARDSLDSPAKQLPTC
jgi:hypothetical protein